MEKHYKSDFTLSLTSVGDTGNLVSLCRECDFSGTVSSGIRSRQVLFGRHGEDFTNCQIKDGRLLIVCDSHGLSPGRVVVQLCVEVPNTDFPDGFERLTTVIPTDLVLTATGPTTATEAEVQAVLPYVSPYAVAKRGGFQGSEAEFNRALGSIQYAGSGDGGVDLEVIAEMADTIKRLKARASRAPYICRRMISINSRPGNVYAMRGIGDGGDAMMYLCRFEEDGDDYIVRGYEDLAARVCAVVPGMGDSIDGRLVIGYFSHCSTTYTASAPLSEFYKIVDGNLVINRNELKKLFGEDFNLDILKLFISLGIKLSNCEAQYCKLSEKTGEMLFMPGVHGLKQHKLNPPTKAELERLAARWIECDAIAHNSEIGLRNIIVQYRKLRSGENRWKLYPAIAHEGKDWVYPFRRALKIMSFAKLFRARRKRGRFYSDWVYFRVYVKTEGMDITGLDRVVIIPAEGDRCSPRKLAPE